MNDLEDRISNITIDDAIFSENGLLTLEEKTKLNGIQEGAIKNVIIKKMFSKYKIDFLNNN